MAIGKTLGKAGAKICVNDLLEVRLENAKKSMPKPESMFSPLFLT